MNFTTVSQAIGAGGSTQFLLAGRYFRLLDTQAPVTVAIGRAGSHYEQLVNVEAGAWAKVKDSEDPFDTILISGTAGQTVKFIVTDGEAGYDRLFVAIAQALTIVQPAAVSVDVVATSLLAQASRKKVIFMADPTNVDDIAIGSSMVTMAGSPAILSPGDIWIEETAASAAWYGISNTTAQTMRILTAV